MALTPADIEQIRDIIREELARAGIASPVAKPAAPSERASREAAMLAAHPEMAAARDRNHRGRALIDELHAGVDGVNRLVAMMSNRAERDQQLLAVEYGGRLGDDALVRVYERLLADRGDPELSEAAFTGLCAMWVMSPMHGAQSKAAYKATLEILEQAPRSGFVLSPTVLVELRGVAMCIDELRGVWFKPAVFRETLGKLLVEAPVDPFGRQVLVDTIVGLGAPRKELDKLRKRLAHSDDFELLRKLDAAIAAAS